MRRVGRRLAVCGSIGFALAILAAPLLGPLAGSFSGLPSILSITGPSVMGPTVGRWSEARAQSAPAATEAQAPAPLAAPTAPVRGQPLRGTDDAAANGGPTADSASEGGFETPAALLPDALASALTNLEPLLDGFQGVAASAVPVLISCVLTLWMLAVCILMRRPWWWLWLPVIVIGTLVIGVESGRIYGDLPRLLLLAIAGEAPGAGVLLVTELTRSELLSDTILVLPFGALMYLVVWWRSVGEDLDDDLAFDDTPEPAASAGTGRERETLALRREDMVPQNRSGRSAMAQAAPGADEPATAEEAARLLDSILEPEDDVLDLRPTRVSTPSPGTLILQRGDIVDDGDRSDVLELTAADQIDEDGLSDTERAEITRQIADEVAAAPMDEDPPSRSVRGEVRGPLGSYTKQKRH